MPKKFILVLMLAFFFSEFSLARAEVVINEFVSNSLVSGDDEWVELLNTGGVDILLDGWMIKDGNIDTKDDISLSGTLSKNGVLVFNHKDGWLNDGGDSISLYNGLNLIYQVVYGAGKDLVAPTMGKSGALISGIWKTDQEPTKGEANEIIVSPPADNLNSSSSVSDTNATTPEPKAKVVETPKIKTQITAKTLGFVGMPLSLDATTLGLSGEPLRYGKYFWNFGDGDSKETEVTYGGKFTHTYFYAGDYVVSLSYCSNFYSNTPDASDQITIKIIETDVTISRVGDEKDFFVELSNNADYSIDLSGWLLTSEAKSFTIPRQTILVAKKKMIISPRITNFSVTDKNTLKLMNSEGEIVFNYTNSVVGRKIPPLLKNSPHPDPLLIKERGQTEIPTDNLSASAISSDVTNNNSGNSYLPIFGSIVFIGASAGAVYFIRQKKILPKEADNFEILDE